MSERLAAFDFDGTLINGDSLLLFARYAVGKRRVVLALAKSLPAIIRWKLGVSSNHAAKQTLFSHLYRGMSYAEFCAKGCSFAGIIESVERREVVERLEEFIRSGVETVIVTASMPQWVSSWAFGKGVTKVIGTEPEVIDGVLTGRFSTPNCYGAEKVSRLTAEYPDIAQREVWAFGDSTGDDALLALASHGVKV